MGTDIGKTVQFSCFHDCKIHKGCPGHTIRCDYHRTSDMMVFYMDEKEYLILDPWVWKAMQEADRLCT